MLRTARRDACPVAREMFRAPQYRWARNLVLCLLALVVVYSLTISAKSERHAYASGNYEYLSVEGGHARTQRRLPMSHTLSMPHSGVHAVSGATVATESMQLHRASRDVVADAASQFQGAESELLPQGHGDADVPLPLQDAVMQAQAIKPQAVAGSVKGPLLIKQGTIKASVPRLQVVVTAIKRLVAAAGGYIENEEASRQDGLVQQYNRLLAAWRTYLASSEREMETAAGTANPSAVSNVTRDTTELAAPVEDRSGLDDYEGISHASVRARIPVAAFDGVAVEVQDTLLQRLAGAPAGILRPVIHAQTTNARDESNSYAETLASQSTDETILRQLNTLMRAATTVDDVLKLRREADQVLARLSTTRQRRKQLEDSGAYSTLTLSLELQLPNAPPPLPSPSASPSPLPPASPEGNAVWMLVVDVVATSWQHVREGITVMMMMVVWAAALACVAAGMAFAAKAVFSATAHLRAEISSIMDEGAGAHTHHHIEPRGLGDAGPTSSLRLATTLSPDFAGTHEP